jgi:predicted transcriptional regulator
MGKSEAVTATLDAETLADLRRLAEHMNCSVDHLVTSAVLRFVDDELGALPPDKDDPFTGLPPYEDPSVEGRALSEAEAAHAAAFKAFIQVGEDAIARGDVISHEDLMAELRERYEQKRDAA